MELNSTIDSQIQKGLAAEGIAFPTTNDGRLRIIEYRMDKKAKVGMLYLQEPSNMPAGGMPFLIVEAKYVYGVFHHESEAMMIEASVESLDGEVIDFYVQDV